jgi:hypothetical protein
MSIKRARIWRPETMLLITRIYIRFWKRHHRSMPMISWASDAIAPRFPPALAPSPDCPHDGAESP